jgi:hypothetical protein
MDVLERHAIIEFPKRSSYSVTFEPTSQVQRKTDFELARFDALGSLPHGRRVYGYRFSDGRQYALWSVTARWVKALPSEQVKEVWAQMEREIKELTREAPAPVVCLYDETIDSEDGAFTVARTKIGVARK